MKQVPTPAGSQEEAQAGPAERLEAARNRVAVNRVQGLAMLDQLFREGRPPDPVLDGSYAGKLVALDIAPGLTELCEWLARRWMPWLGKRFHSASNRGDNVLRRDSLALVRLFQPLYRGVVPGPKDRFFAFGFVTYLANGKEDTDRKVLKIDYDLRENPALTVRRVLDELVQIGPGLYLGKAHLHWWWGRWQRVAFFSLSALGQQPDGQESGDRASQEPYPAMS